jgi:hypothetical protein
MPLMPMSGVSDEPLAQCAHQYPAIALAHRPLPLGESHGAEVAPLVQGRAGYRIPPFPFAAGQPELTSLPATPFVLA